MPQEDELDLGHAETARIGRILAEIEAVDFELVDPPPEIWAGIEASLSAGEAGPRQPPSRQTPTRMVIEYRIGADDVITDVGGGWAEFARTNDAPELAAPTSDRTLWSHIGSDEIVELWQLLVQRVRSGRAAASFPYRCDAPHARRWFEMTVTPESDGRVHFRSVLAFEELREPVSLLDLNARRDADAEPVPLCSWCGRGRHGVEWFDIEEVVRAGRLLEQSTVPPVIHGICETCRDDMAKEFLVAGRVGESPT